MQKRTLSMASIQTYRHQCTLCTGVFGQAALITSRTTVIKTIGVSMFIKCLITGVITEYKTENLEGPEFLHRNTGVRHFRTT